MNNAYCFCPDFFSTLTFSQFHEAIVDNKNSIILDKKNKLMEQYTDRIEDNQDLLLLVNFIDILDVNQKIMSNHVGDKVDSKFLLETVKEPSIQEKKFLATRDRYQHNVIHDDLVDNNICQVYPHSFVSTYTSDKYRTFDIQVFEDDLIHSISIIMESKNDRLYENEYNKGVSGCLKAKRYNAVDQATVGKSLSGLRLGNLDIAILESGFYKTIVEPLFLKDMTKKEFYNHLNKLVLNYNPFRILHTFLVVYYNGDKKNYSTFVSNYLDRLNNLDANKLDNSSSWFIASVKEVSSEYPSVRIFKLCGKINDFNFVCTNIVADFSK
ncbi:hypothetical protein DX883_06430 [Vibrio fluvialis]|nr:hypothetical protein [Vibrio fluvialis]